VQFISWEEFMVDSPFEIPQQMRDLAEQNIKQAHAAYEQLTDFVTKAMDAWMGAMPSSALVVGFKDVQDRAAEIAKKNADSAFALVEKIAKAQNSRNFDASDAVRPRPDEGLHHANAGASQADWGNCPEGATRLIFPSRQTIHGASASNDRGAVVSLPPRAACSSCVWPSPGAGGRAVKSALCIAPQYYSQRIA
jgi:hypothetical protein